MVEHPDDICACGHYRHEHPGNGSCDHDHLAPGCVSFRLSCTDAEMRESEAAWQAYRAERGDGDE